MSDTQTTPQSEQPLEEKSSDEVTVRLNVPPPPPAPAPPDFRYLRESVDPEQSSSDDLK